MNADPRIAALPDIHGHAKGEHKPFGEERPIPYTARMLFLWFYHACRRQSPRFLMVADHVNYLTFEDPAAVNLVRRALKLAQAGDLYGAAETAGVELGHAAAVSEGLRKGMRYSIGAEIDNDPRSRPDAQNIVDAMRPDGMIRSVHFISIAHPQHGENWMWPFDNPEFKDVFEMVGTEHVWESYVSTLLDAIEKLPGHIVGHFYVPAKFGHWPDQAKLETYEDRLLDACAERGMAVEINSRYFYKYYPPGDEQIERFRNAYLRLIRKAKAKGVMIAVGSDAHSPKDQGGAFDAVLALLDEAEVNEIAFPINGRLARVALRATEEILRQHSAAITNPAPLERIEAAGRDAGSDADEPSSDAPAALSAPVPARPRPRQKARPAEPVSSGLVDAAVERPAAVPVATREAAPELPAVAKPRPSKRKTPGTESPLATESMPIGPPPEAKSAVSDDVAPKAAPPRRGKPDDERGVAAAVTEPVVEVAERIVTVVAETAKRAGSALIDATANLLKPKHDKPRRDGKRERPANATRSGGSDARKDSATASPRTKASGTKAGVSSKAASSKAASSKAASSKSAAPAKAAPSPKASPSSKKLPAKATATRAAAKPAARKAAAQKSKPARALGTKASTPKSSPKKATTRASAAKKAATKRPAPKKAARLPAKQAARKTARPAAKPAKKATAHGGAVSKSQKRSVAKRPSTGAKKAAAKSSKASAKKKAGRSRR